MIFLYNEINPISFNVRFTIVMVQLHCILISLKEFDFVKKMKLC